MKEFVDAVPGFDFTVAVNATGWPKPDGSADTASVVAVAPGRLTLLFTTKPAVVPGEPTVFATESVGVMRNSTPEEFALTMSPPLAHTNVCGVPVGLEVRPVSPSPPEAAVAAFQVLPPFGLYCTAMLHVSDTASIRL